MRSNIVTAAVLHICVLASSLGSAEEGTPLVESVLGTQVAELLEIGFERGSKQLANSERLYQSLKSEAPKDPRIDYAHGLVLWKQMKNKEAQAQFLAATQSPGDAYRPAWKALIWTCFVAKSDETGYARLVDFARLIANSEHASQHAGDADAGWIGNVMGAVELTVETSQRRENWLQAEAKLTEILGKELTEVYVSGKADVHARHSLLENEIHQAREKSKQQRAEELERKQNRLQKSLDGAKEKRESLKKSAAEMKETFTEKSAEYRKRIERLEKDYDLGERRAATLLSSMLAIDRQVEILQESRRGQNNVTVNRTDQAIAQLLNQRAIHNADYMRAIAVVEQIAASAQLLNQAQAEMVDQYQNATGEIVAEDASAEKWKERTLKQANALKKANAKPTVPKGKIQLVRSFRTYVDLDLNAERATLLESFGVSTAEK